MLENPLTRRIDRQHSPDLMRGGCISCRETRALCIFNTLQDLNEACYPALVIE